MAEKISVLTASMYLGFSTVVLHGGMCVWKIQRNCDTAPFSVRLCTVDIYLFYKGLCCSASLIRVRYLFQDEFEPRVAGQCLTTNSASSIQTTAQCC